MRILVTGATGIVGAETLARLRAGEGVEAVGTSRGGRRALAERAVGEVHPIVAWDLLEEPVPAQLRGPWDAIVHTAADTRWTLGPDEALRANVDTVSALAPLVGSATHVVHVSTAFATGLRGSVDSPAREDYRNTYEWSKAGAERLASATFPALTIVRPPLVIGRSSDGAAARFTGMYTVLRAMSAGMVPALVAIPDAPFDVVPVDALAALLEDVGRRREPAGVLTIAGGERAVTVSEAIGLIAEELNEWRTSRGAGPFEVPRMIPPESWERFFLPLARKALSPRQLKVLELLGHFRPYLTLEEPLRPTNQVEDARHAIATSVRYWADANPRLALTPIPTPRPSERRRHK